MFIAPYGVASSFGIDESRIPPCRPKATHKEMHEYLIDQMDYWEKIVIDTRVHPDKYDQWEWAMAMMRVYANLLKEFYGN